MSEQVRDWVGETAEAVEGNLLDVLCGVSKANDRVRHWANGDDFEYVCCGSHGGDMELLCEAVRAARRQFRGMARKELICACAWFVMALLHFEPTAFCPPLPSEYVDVGLWLSHADAAQPVRAKLVYCW